MRRLVFFVDALPFVAVARLLTGELRRTFSSAKPMAPSIGYSVNLHQEMFAGRRPDDAGFFGVRNRLEHAVNLPYRKIRRVQAAFRTLAPQLDRYSRPVWNRILRWETDFIPLHLVENFAPAIPDLLVTESSTALFQRPGWERAVADLTGAGGLMADQVAMDRARALASTTRSHLFVALTSPDRIGHKHGCPSPEMDSVAGRMLSHFLEIMGLMERNGGVEDATLVSDHGMSTVNETLRCGIESQVPGCGANWLCYYDSLYLKVWSDEQSLIDDARAYLEPLPGRVLTEGDRVRLGVSNPEFGDLIFVLDEGTAFAPNFFARRVSKGYHGYVWYGDPHMGLFLSTLRTEQSTITPLDVFTALESASSSKR